MLKKYLLKFIPYILLLFLLRVALPQYIKYLIFPLTGIFVLLSVALYVREGRYRALSISRYKVFTPLVSITLLLVYAILSTSYLSNQLLKDILNLLLVLTFTFALVLADPSKQELSDAIKKFVTLTIWFGVFFALAGIAKLYMQLKGIYLDFLKPEGFSYPEGTSLGIDSNFYSLLSIIAMLFIVPRLFEEHSPVKALGFQLGLYAISLSSILSTSRRGLIISLLLFILLAILSFLSFVFHSKVNRNIFRNSWLFILLMVGTFAIWYIALYRVDSLARNRWLVESSFDRAQVNTYINIQVHSAESILKGTATFNEVSDMLWDTPFDPRFPYSGWAAGSYTLVNDLGSLGLNGVPSDAKGARIGRGNSNRTSNGKAFYISKLFDVDAEKGKRYMVTLYVYVSPDFDGSWVRLSTSGRNRGIREWYYDMRRKGSWQPLQISFVVDSTDSRVHFSICNENDSTFNHLNGHVIFAYPQLSEIQYDPKNPLTWASTQFEPVEVLPANWSNFLPKGTIAYKPLRSNVRYREKDSLLYFGSGLFRYTFQDSLRVIPSLYVWVSPDFNGDEVYLAAGGKRYGFTKHNYNLSKKGTWQKLYLSYSMFDGNSSVDFGFRKKQKNDSDSIKGYVLFAYPEERFMRFNPNEPITWAGTNFKRIYPLRGSHVELVPSGSAGMRIDSDAQANVSKNLSYNVNPIRKIKIPGNNYRVKSSVYVYASDDFSGKNLRLGGSTKDLWGNAHYYDLDKKGQWQKLTINNWGKADDEYYSTTYFENPGSKDFSNLKGYVIWASPSFKLMKHNPNDPETYTSSTYIREYPLEGKNAEIVPSDVAGARYTANTEGKQWNDIYHSTTLYWGLPVEAGDSIFISVYCYVSPDFDGNEARVEIRGKVKGQRVERYNLNEKGKWVLLKASAIATEKGKVYGAYLFLKKGVTDFSNLKGYVTFAYPQLVVKTGKISSLAASKRLSLAGFMAQEPNKTETDTTGNGFVRIMTDDSFAGPRIDRWRYTYYIYVNEYGPIQKIFGGGFDYTKKFANEFFKNEPNRNYDYPHNPFLSALLYSGLVGFIIYLWFNARAVYLYYKHRRQYWIFGAAFLITSFYSFFSSNMPFEPGIFGVLSILPYVFEFVERKK
jgi:hypothetical protein